MIWCFISYPFRREADKRLILFPILLPDMSLRPAQPLWLHPHTATAFSLPRTTKGGFFSSSAWSSSWFSFRSIQGWRVRSGYVHNDSYEMVAATFVWNDNRGEGAVYLAILRWFQVIIGEQRTKPQTWVFFKMAAILETSLLWEASCSNFRHSS